MKRDIYGHEERYKKWKEEAVKLGVEGLTKKNSDLLIQYVSDMEIGVNISNKNKKGPRSYPRLNNLRQRLRQIMVMLQDRKVGDFSKITEKEVMQFFSDMHTGEIKNQKGQKYRSVGDYAKVFTSFWHWWMKVNRKQGTLLEDITEEIDKSSDKARFVYITKEKLDELLPYLNEDEQTIVLFVFDSIIRSPTELLSLKVSDIYKKEGEIWVNVSGEISKTGFDRSFNLIYSGDAITEFIKKHDLQLDQYLFDFLPKNLTGKIQQIAKQLWGDKLSNPMAGGKYGDLSLYDLRHSGAIHLRILAKKTGKISLDAIRQRGGWVTFDMLNYYTKFIGLDGSIDKNHLVIEEDKSRLEKEMEEMRQKMKEMEDNIKKFRGMALEEITGKVTGKKVKVVSK